MVSVIVCQYSVDIQSGSSEFIHGIAIGDAACSILKKTPCITLPENSGSQPDCSASNV